MRGRASSVVVTHRITIEPLPADASGQREQLVRRHAAHDHDIDPISMDEGRGSENGAGADPSATEPVTAS